MKPNKIKIFITICFILITCFSFAQETGTPFITNYPQNEYNFHNQNWGVVKDNRGVLYFANGNGILEFDGTDWRRIFVENRYRVRSIAIDDNGIIYVGASGAFGFLAPDSLGKMQYNSISANYDTAILKVFPNIWRTRIVNNEVYFAGKGAIYKYSPYKITDHINEKIKAFYPTRKFFLSYATNNKFFVQDATEGLSIIRDDTLMPIPGLNGLSVIYAMLPGVGENNPDEILIATKDELLTYDPNADTTNGGLILSHFQTAADEFFKTNLIYDVIKLPGSYLAVATLSKGIVIIDYQGNIIDYVNAQNGLQDETVLSMSYFDNSLWLTLNNGISQVEMPSPFRFWDTKNEIKGNIQTIHRFNNTLYLATTEGVFYYDTAFNKNMCGLPLFHKTEGGYREAWCFLKFYDKSSNDTILLMGQNNLTEIDKNNKTKLISRDLVFCLTQSLSDPDIVYGGKQKSIVILKRNHKKNSWDTNEIEGFPGQVTNIVEFNDELWLSTLFNGVYKIQIDTSKDFLNCVKEDYEIMHFDTVHGLKGVSRIRVYIVDNELIFTTPDGIFKYDKDKNRFLPDDEFGKIFCESGNRANQITQNNNGDLWIDNLGVLYKQNDGTYLFDSIFAKRIPIDIKGCYPDGNCWYAGGANGLLRYDKQNDYNYNQGYSTIIRQISINNDSIIFYGTNFKKSDSTGIYISSLVQPRGLKPVIDYEFNNLTFEYSSLYLISPQSTEYSYKLDGFDEDWSLWKSETKKEYTNLRQGKYVFQVKAKNIYGSESEIASYRFQILPPWYSTWWAYACYVILLIFLIWIIVKLNERRLVEAKIQLEKIVSLRTEEILQQKEEIQMQADYLSDLNDEISNKNTELSKQKEEIETIVKELKTTNATKDKLFSIIAHDLKSPFNVIFGFTSLLKENYEYLSEDKRKHYINEIDKSSKSAFQLLENLLLWALSQQGKITITKTDANLKHLVNEAISPYLFSSDKKEIKINIKIPDNTLAYVDGHTIKTVLANLFNNAVKFTPNKGVITIGATTMDGFVEIKVSDTGVGIPAGALAKIFKNDETHSTLGTNHEKGTGLGLSLCKEFVGLHGGKIWVESTEGSGSGFYFTIPHKSNNKGAINSIDGKGGSKLTREGKKLKILIAEDNEAIDVHLTIILESLNTEILHTKTGAGAVELCRAHKNIDLVLMDISMPDMDGIEATRKIRGFNKEIVIIAQTAFTLGDEREKAIEAGCDDYLSKPIEKKPLLKKIGEYLS